MIIYIWCNFSVTLEVLNRKKIYHSIYTYTAHAFVIMLLLWLTANAYWGYGFAYQNLLKGYLLTLMSFQTCEDDLRFSKEYWKQKQLWFPLTSIIFLGHTVEMNENRNSGHQRSSKYLLLCSAEERKSYRFGRNVSKWPNFHFWADCCFKKASNQT